MHYQFIKYSDSIWNESNDDWDEKYISWKAIGTVKNKYPREVSFETKLRSLLEEFLSENIFKKATLYHVIEYQSDRLDLGYDYCEYKLNSYVVVEADRGEDCGKVIGVASEVSYKEFITKQRYLGNEVELKKIIRQASDNDIEELKMRKEDENACLKQCKELVESKNINMEILSCEYQWDMKKITFYFKSGKRIDFRDLLKELFKIFKIRIWLCAEKRSMNCFIREILE